MGDAAKPMSRIDAPFCSAGDSDPPFGQNIIRDTKKRNLFVSTPSLPSQVESLQQLHQKVCDRPLVAPDRVRSLANHISHWRDLRYGAK